MTDRLRPLRRPFVVVALALALTALLLAVEARTYLGIFDEGWVWYGAWRTALGEVPLRDFQSYEPGRFYWAAPFLWTMGPGIVAFRVACAAFAVPGLVLGFSTLGRVIRSRGARLVSAAILLLWMLPGQKIFEHSFALAAVWLGTRLIEAPSPRRHFEAGALAGLATFFGLNLGLYTAVAVGALVLLTWHRGDGPSLGRRAIVGAGGFLLGVSPLIGMLAFVPGFAGGIGRDLASMIEAGSTNLPRSVPWPWRFDYLGMAPDLALRSLAVGCLYLTVPVFYAGLAIHLWRRSRRGDTDLSDSSVATAAVAVGLPFLHHAFARPDPSHLVQALQPFLIGVLALPTLVASSRRGRPTAAYTTGEGERMRSPIPQIVRIARSPWAAIAALLALTVSTPLTLRPLGRLLSGGTGTLVSRTIRGDRLWIRSERAPWIDAMVALDERSEADGTSIYLAAYAPGLYVVIDQPSPTWEFLSFFPPTARVEAETIRALETERVGWIVVNDAPATKRPWRRFRMSHPRLWRAIRERYEKVPPVGPLEGLPPGHVVFRRVRPFEDAAVGFAAARRNGHADRGDAARPARSPADGAVLATPSEPKVPWRLP